MGGRKNPKPTENEKEHEYVLHQKVSHGDQVVGDRAEFLEDKGAVGEVKARREAWLAAREGQPEVEEDSET